MTLCHVPIAPSPDTELRERSPSCSAALRQIRSDKRVPRADSGSLGGEDETFQGASNSDRVLPA